MAVELDHSGVRLWEATREHVTTSLMMDAQWLVDEPASLTWWPTALPQRFAVTGHGLTADASDQTYLKVTVDTIVARADEELGSSLASEFQGFYPLGALVYAGDALVLTTSVVLTPTNESVLTWLHHAALIQATTAYSLAGIWQESRSVASAFVAHPESGMRENPDELLEIYGGEVLGLSVSEDAAHRYVEALNQLGPIAAQAGFVARVGGATSLVIGAPDGREVVVQADADSGWAGSFGPGFTVLAPVFDPGQPLPASVANDANISAALAPGVGQLGFLVQNPTEDRQGLFVLSYLPYGPLVRYLEDTDQLARFVFTVAVMVLGSASMLASP